MLGRLERERETRESDQTKLFKSIPGLESRKNKKCPSEARQELFGRNLIEETLARHLVGVEQKSQGEGLVLRVIHGKVHQWRVNKLKYY